jgi:hypothetical protein
VYEQVWDADHLGLLLAQRAVGDSPEHALLIATLQRAVLDACQLLKPTQNRSLRSKIRRDRTEDARHYLMTDRCEGLLGFLELSPEWVRSVLVEHTHWAGTWTKPERFRPPTYEQDDQ